MFDSIVIAKLEGLHSAVKSELRNSDWQNFGGKRIINLFERYEQLRSQLTKSHPNLFDDIPAKEIPPEDPLERLNLRRPQIEDLLADIEILQTIVRSYSGTASFTPTITREGVFFSGQTFDSLRSVQSLIEIATSQVWLIDNYIDSSVLDLLTSKSENVRVLILTKDITPSLRTTAQKFNQQYKGLEIRSSDLFHDRFLIIDDRDFYHFGASIKDLGKRSFMFSRIEEIFVINSLRQEFNSAWSQANVEI